MNARPPQRSGRQRPSRVNEIPSLFCFGACLLLRGVHLRLSVGSLAFVGVVKSVLNLEALPDCDISLFFLAGRGSEMKIRGAWQITVAITGVRNPKRGWRVTSPNIHAHPKFVRNVRWSISHKLQHLHVC